MEKDPFRTRDHVADFDRHVEAYAALSRAARADLPMIADVPYGNGPDETLDLFFPVETEESIRPGGFGDAGSGNVSGGAGGTSVSGGVAGAGVAGGAADAGGMGFMGGAAGAGSAGRAAGAGGPRPVHLFVHGGYWRMFSKADFSFVARGVTAAGAIAAVMDYSLMPTVRMATIVEQVRRAAGWLAANAAAHGGDPARLTVSGHSAGAHLCTFLIDGDEAAPVRGALLLSGVYDLAPLQFSFLAPLIALTDDEVRRFSPLTRRHAGHAMVHIAHGDRETAPFHTQAAALHTHLAADGLAVTSTTLPATDHMTAALDLADPTTAAGRLLARLLAA